MNKIKTQRYYWYFISYEMYKGKLNGKPGYAYKLCRPKRVRSMGNITFSMLTKIQDDSAWMDSLTNQILKDEKRDPKHWFVRIVSLAYLGTSSKQDYDNSNEAQDQSQSTTSISYNIGSNPAEAC